MITDLQKAISITKASKKKLGMMDLENGGSTLSSTNTRIKSPVLESKGDDFLFLFDLIAHTCGKSATLRVLSYTAPSFAKLCQPVVLNDRITKTENSLKIEWEPAKLQDMRQYDKLEVEEYVATIFSSDNAFHDWKNLGQNCRSAEFKNLKGGTTKYMVTISAMVGNAKMKGVTLKTFLPPFPPQKLHCSSSEIMENTKFAKAKITWTPPKGNFEKYSLGISQIASRQSIFPSMVRKECHMTYGCQKKLKNTLLKM